MCLLNRLGWVGVVVGAAIVVAGCSSGKTEEMSVPPAVSGNSPSVLKSCVLGIAPAQDLRPTGNFIRMYSSFYNRPEAGGFTMVDLPQYLSRRFGESGIFSKVTFVPPSKDADLVLNIKQNVTSVRLDTWVPFVFKIHVAFDYDLELVNARKQVVWKYALKDASVNYPSAFRVRGVFNAVVFEERMLEEEFPKLMESLCLSAAENPALFTKSSPK